jgi:glycosyltransferase involved in cell wall biosynthesis
MEFWSDFGFNRSKLDYWPTGIDTNYFKERSKENCDVVLIYFKQRKEEELNIVKNLLEENKIKFETIIYGKYDQKDYLEKLKSVKYLIWIGRQESQGIALQEALATNVPILVWDVSSVGHWEPSSEKEKEIFNDQENNYNNTTSAYYFDDTCGIKTKEKESLKMLIEEMESRWREFEPRNYILKNLNLKKQASDLLKLFEKHFGIKYDDGLKEKALNDKRWSNYGIFFRFKENIKLCLKKYHAR